LLFDWGMFIGEDAKYVYKHFLLDPEVVKKQYPESAKREFT
jgi:hypothetical protein